MKTSRTRLVIGVAAVSALGLSACVANNPSSTSASGSAGASDAPLTVTITDDTCKVSAASVPSGVVTFKLTNNGTVRNEFEILAEDKLRIVGERENLGPGTSVDYTVTLQPGKYFTACKKNMVGALVGAAEFTVTDSEGTDRCRRHQLHRIRPRSVRSAPGANQVLRRALQEG